MGSTSRRQFLKYFGGAILVGATHGIFGAKALDFKLDDILPKYDPIDPKVLAVREAAQYSNPSSLIAALKELYSDDKEVMKDLVFNKNPLLNTFPKSESSWGGHYFPIPMGSH